MKSLKTILAAMALCICGTAAAQAVYTDKEGNTYTFQKHLYLQLQGGAQYTLGESSFKNLISPNAQVALGWQFHHVIGARFSVGAWQSKGGYNGYQVNGGPAGNIDYKWNYVAPAIDFTFNLTNLIGGYNPTRVVDINAFIGGGANIAFGNSEANDIAKKGYTMEYLWDGTKVRGVGRAGLAIDFKVSKAVSLGLEANANILTDAYNSKKAGNADWYFNALAGIKINLGKTYTKKAKPAPEPEPAPAPAPVVEKKPAPAPVAAPAKEPLTRNVFFTIRVAKISDSEQSKVSDVVAYLNKYPEAKVVVTGYADKGTGTEKYNAAIAEKRALAVCDALVAAGISADRITQQSKGDTVQPFTENDQNRVTICVAE